MSLQDLTKISPRILNSTPIIAYVCLRLDIASPLHLDGSLLRLSFAFLRGKYFTLQFSRLMSPHPLRARHAHRAHRSAASYMLNCKQQKAERAVVEL